MKTPEMPNNLMRLRKVAVRAVTENQRTMLAMDMARPRMRLGNSSERQTQTPVPRPKAKEATTPRTGRSRRVDWPGM